MLNIGSEQLPKDVATARMAIVAQVEGGKTYLAGIMEEEMVENQIPMVILDGMGAHWGIRSEYQVPIIGHMNHLVVHADIEVEPTDGRIVAYTIVEGNRTVLLDISGWNRDQQRLFVTDLLEAMYRINKTPRHIVIEEADMFAPQTMENKIAKSCFFAVDNIVRRGRQLGFGTTLITQRPTLLNKNVLNQTQLLFVGHMEGPRDIATIKDYLRHVGLDELKVKDFLDSVASMKKNEKLLISPQWLERTELMGVRRRKSYHAGRTPRLGEEENIPALVSIDKTSIIKDMNAFQEQLNRKLGLLTDHPESHGNVMDFIQLKHPTPKNLAIMTAIALGLLFLAVTI